MASPGLHNVAAVAPVGQKEPTVQSRHCALLFISVVRFACVPAVHGSDADAPTSQ